MDIKIQARNLSLNDEIKAQIQQKVEHVNRRLPIVTEAGVELSSEATRSQEDRIVAQVTLLVNGNIILRGEERGPTPLAAINAVADTLDRRVRRYKSRVYRSERMKQTPSIGEQQAEEVATLPVPPEPEEAMPDGKVVRVKRFGMKPMTVEDAAFQMQMLGHRFFMFLNAETNQYNVLYLRDDGDYGLILPEVG